MEDLRVNKIVDLQEITATGVAKDHRFLAAAALDLGVLGQRPARATSSGIESVICCHSAIAWA
jgi:hypothetical protein